MALAYHIIKLDLLNLNAGLWVYHLMYTFEFEFIHTSRLVLKDKHNLSACQTSLVTRKQSFEGHCFQT